MLPPAPRSRAFTLMESMVSLGVVAVIGAAVGSSMLLAARAAPRPGDFDTSCLAVSREIDAMLADAALAQTIITSSDKHVEFTVADRDGDDVPETIRYEWADQKDTPLVRTFNGKPTDGVLLREFVLTIDSAASDETYAGPAAEGTEYILTQYDLPTGNNNSNTMNSSRRYAQAFLPRVPVEATAYRVSRVLVRLSGLTLAQTFRVDLYAQDAAGNPTGTSLGGGSVTNVGLVASSGMVSFFMSGSTARSPDLPLIFVLRQTAGLSATVSTQSPVADAVALYAYSSNSGTTWSQSPDLSLRYQVHGYATLPTLQTISRTRARSLTVYARVGEDAASGVTRSVPLASRPILSEAAPVVAPDTGVVGRLSDFLLGGG